MENKRHRIDPYVEKIQFIKDDLKHLPNSRPQSPDEVVPDQDLKDQLRSMFLKRKKNKLEHIYQVPVNKTEKERIQESCDNLARLQQLMQKPKGW